MSTTEKTGLDQLRDFVESHPGWRLYINGYAAIDVDPKAEILKAAAGRTFDLANGEQIMLTLTAERPTRAARAKPSHLALGAFTASLHSAFCEGAQIQTNGALEQCASWLSAWEKSLAEMDEIIRATDIAKAATLIREMRGDHVNALLSLFEISVLPDLDHYLRLLQASRAYGKPPKALADFAQDEGWNLGSRGPLHWYTHHSVNTYTERIRIVVVPNWDDPAADHHWSVSVELENGQQAWHRSNSRQEITQNAVEIVRTIELIPAIRTSRSRAAAEEMVGRLRGWQLGLLRDLLDLPPGPAGHVRKRIVQKLVGARFDGNTTNEGNK